MRSSFENDSDIVQGCIKKDLVAWSAFVKKYSILIAISTKNRLKKYGINISHHDIEDVKQNVLSSIWKDKKLEGVKNRQDISYWLAVVSGNMAIEYVRKNRSQEPLRTISIFDKINETEFAELIPSTNPNPGEESAREEISNRIEGAIDSLPTKEKLIIRLNLLHGKKYNEISDILNIPAGTVSNYIKRAKERLKKSLKYLQ